MYTLHQVLKLTDGTNNTSLVSNRNIKNRNTKRSSFISNLNEGPADRKLSPPHHRKFTWVSLIGLESLVFTEQHSSLFTHPSFLSSFLPRLLGSFSTSLLWYFVWTGFDRRTPGAVARQPDPGGHGPSDRALALIDRSLM